MATTIQHKVCLVVIDGWGLSDETKGNAVANANAPVMHGFAEAKNNRYTTLAAHGLTVGLPDGLMGNSEVGHLNIGAGRIVYQDIVRIDLSLKDGSFQNNPRLVAAFDHAKKTTGRLHLLGLVSDGGVHSHNTHLYSLLSAAKAAGVPDTIVHFFGDGRDTQPKSAVKYMGELLNYINKISYGRIGIVVGRYYAMDRDTRWERIQVAYDALVSGHGAEETSDVIKTIEERYEKNETDEFLKPIQVTQNCHIQDNDTLLFFDFRSDRMREIVETFGFDEKKFANPSAVRKGLNITTFTQYKGTFPFPVLFQQQSMENVLAEWLSKHNIPQFHCAETEKYAHVTFFFNGGTEKAYNLEDRLMVPSPKVATYDLQPSMSALQVGEEVAKVVATEKYPFVMCNFAPPDMVGHTGIYEAAIKGVEATDKAIGTIYEACKKHGYVLFVTADHGNAEQMLSPEGGPHTAHTCNRVPFVMTTDKHDFVVPAGHDPKLADVAPTVLKLMGLPIPSEMDGVSLV